MQFEEANNSLEEDSGLGAVGHILASTLGGIATAIAGIHFFHSSVYL